MTHSRGHVLSAARCGYLASAFGLALALHSGAAHAVTKTYDGSKCRTSNFGEDAPTDTTNTGVFHDTTNKKVKNTSTSATYTVHCPITKTTSGPSATSDAITAVAVPYESTGGTIDCHVNTWSTAVFGSSDVNKVGDAHLSSTLTGTRTMTITTPVNTPTPYWNANGTAGADREFWGTQPAWYYAELACTLAPGMKLGQYVVTEAGTTQTGYTINPIVNCALDPSTNMHWRYVDTSPGGFYIAQSALSLSPFAVTCPMVNNTMVEVAVGRGLSGNLSGCNFNNVNLSSPTWTPWLGQGEWEFDVMPIQFSSSGVITVPVSQTYSLTCGQSGQQGDSKYLSYRTKPNPSRSGFTATASHNNAEAGLGIDNNPATRWTSKTNAVANMWYQIDTGPSGGLSTVEMTIDSGSSSNDYLRQFTLYESDDASNWNVVTTGTGTTRFVSAIFSERPSRYFRVQLNSGFGAWWSIAELNVFNNDGL